jgi:hypothetical protein
MKYIKWITFTSRVKIIALVKVIFDIYKYDKKPDSFKNIKYMKNMSGYSKLQFNYKTCVFSQHSRQHM